MYKSQEACNQWLKNNIIYYHTFEWKICDLVEHAFEAGCNYILDNLEGRKIQLEESANSAGERSPDGENNKQSESLLCPFCGCNIVAKHKNGWRECQNRRCTARWQA